MASNVKRQFTCRLIDDKMDCVTEVQIWLNDKYREWEKSQPMPRQSVSDWARYIGLHPSVLINYMNGKRKPSGNNLEIIAGKVGAEIYDKLKRPRPDPGLQFIIQNWGEVSDESRSEAVELFQRAIERGATEPDRKRVGKTQRK